MQRSFQPRFPSSWVTSVLTLTPFLSFHGDRDLMVPYQQSKLLHQALTLAGVEAHLEILSGAGHGGPEFQRDKIGGQIVEFFDRHLRGN